VIVSFDIIPRFRKSSDLNRLQRIVAEETRKATVPPLSGDLASPSQRWQEVALLIIIPKIPDDSPVHIVESFHALTPGDFKGNFLVPLRGLVEESFFI
jgi:hypothetical protein